MTLHPQGSNKHFFQSLHWILALHLKVEISMQFITNKTNIDYS